MIAIILTILAGIFNACMDVLKYRYDRSIFKTWKNQQWIDPSISWKNKWKISSSMYGETTQKERFFGSSTFLVGLTDFWHFSKTMMITLLIAAIIFYNPIFNACLDFFILYCSFTITFEIFFSKILIKKKNI